MKVTILGSGTSVPLADRASPSLAIFIEGRFILMDIGPGTVRQVKPPSVRFFQQLQELVKPFWCHDRERLSRFEHRRIPRCEKEVDQIGRVIGMKMADEDIVDILVFEACNSQLPHGPRADIHHDEPTIYEDRHGRRRPVGKGDAGAGTEDSYFHMVTVGSAGIGIMEKWNDGIMGSKGSLLSYHLFCSSIPTFHPSFSKDATL